MERDLTEWERAVVNALANLERDGVERIRESIPFLVFTGGCECGCASFNVRDRRYPPTPHQLTHFSNGAVAEPSVGLALWAGPDGRPVSIDIDNAPGSLFDPEQIAASRP